MSSLDSHYKSLRSEMEGELKKIFSNLEYTWDKDTYSFIDRLDSYNWRKTLNPASIIHRYLEETPLKDLKEDVSILSESVNRQDEYLSSKKWFDYKIQDDSQLKRFERNPVVYFCAEYGLVDWLQIYSGGLGVLAGDFIKQASDHGFPMVAVGLFYNQGYFHQDINMEGLQTEVYIPQSPAASFLELVKNEDYGPLEVSVRIKGRDVYIRAWELDVGNVKVYLLDTNCSKNKKWEDRMITTHLYGGNNDTRIRQELVLGIGGYKLIKRLGIDPGVVHLNEGHASFVILEKLREYITDMDFPSAIEEAKKNVLFTNHTLVAAGNDKFSYEELRPYMEPIAERLKISYDDIFSYGQDSKYSKDGFAMTILGLQSSTKSNAVSHLHGDVARKIWPDYNVEAITNGVHMPTWVGKEVQDLLCRYVNPKWSNPAVDVNWEKIRDIPNHEIWDIHRILKAQMVDRINSTLGMELSKDALTVVWSRRFASYKRPNLFYNDLEHLSYIVNNADRPVQFLIGGKAHPRDTLGKEMLQKVVKIGMEERFKNKVVFMTGYNWNLARYVVAGADVWLNNPIRYEEASGTSGMKAGANGVLQFTTLDGWTDEIDWYGKGWVLPQEDIQDKIYTILKDQIATLYFSSDVPDDWIHMMKETMIVCLSRYNMGRMLEEYIGLYDSLFKS